MASPVFSAGAGLIFPPDLFDTSGCLPPPSSPLVICFRKNPTIVLAKTYSASSMRHDGFDLMEHQMGIHEPNFSEVQLSSNDGSMASKKEVDLRNALSKYLFRNTDRVFETRKPLGRQRNAVLQVLQNAVHLPSALARTADKLPASVLNTLLRHFSQLQKWEKASQLFEWMVERDKVNAASYTTYFTILGKSGNARRALQIYGKLNDKDIRLNVFVCNALLGALVHCWKSHMAFKMFKQMQLEGLHPDIVTYGTVISGCLRIENGDKKAEKFFNEMQRKGCKPHAITYGALLNVYGMNGREKEAKALFKELIGSGFTPNAYHYSGLLHIAAANGNQDEAKNILSEMTKHCKPDKRIYMDLLKVFSMNGFPDVANVIFESIRHSGLKNDTAAYSLMIDAYARAGRFKETQAFYEKMQKKGLKPDASAITSLISLYANSGDSEILTTLAKSDSSWQRGKFDIRVLNAFLRAYSHLEHEVGLKATLEKMDDEGISPNRTTFNILMSHLCKQKLYDAARQAFEDMKLRGIQPDRGSYVTLMVEFIVAGKIDLVLVMLDDMKKAGLRPPDEIFENVILSLVHHGKTAEACLLFNDMKAFGSSPLAIENVVREFAKVGSLKVVRTTLVEWKQSRYEPSQATLDIILSKIMEHRQIKLAA